LHACVTPHRPMPKARLSDATATLAEPLPSNAESSRGVPLDRVVGREPYSRSDLVLAPLKMPGQLPFAPAATVAKNAMRLNDCDGFREGFTRRRKLL
jgi:hypothetical protein